MDASIYRLMAQTQRDHWWFRARRRILDSVLKRLLLPSAAHVLEVGCGTGGNLRMLSEFGQVKAMEIDDFAIEVASSHDCAEVRKGWLPDGIPYPNDERFDLICLFDVLEHCADDKLALLALRPLLAPGGYLVLTVPAYQWLFGEHDRLHHHYRRYTAGRLRQLAQGAGLRVARVGYFNTLLFPVVAARRLLERVGLGQTEGDAQMPGPLTNRLLFEAFASECMVVPRVAFPFGTSVLAVLRLP